MFLLAAILRDLDIENSDLAGEGLEANGTRSSDFILAVSCGVSCHGNLRVLQWLFLVPLKGGIGGIVHPPIGRGVSGSPKRLFLVSLSYRVLFRGGGGCEKGEGV